MKLEAPPADPQPPIGSRWLYRLEYALEVVGPLEGFAGYVQVEWERMGAGVMPTRDWATGRLALEGSQCEWCWGALGDAWWEVAGGRYCGVVCAELQRAAFEAARRSLSPSEG